MKFFVKKPKDTDSASLIANPTSTALAIGGTKSRDETVSEVVGWNPGRFVELGTIEYVNLTPDGRHGDYDRAVDAARRTGRPIFANFAEWSG